MKAGEAHGIIRGGTMTLKQMYLERHGKNGWKTVPPSLRRIIEKIDASNVGVKPVSRKELEEALG